MFITQAISKYKQLEETTTKGRGILWLICTQISILLQVDSTRSHIFHIVYVQCMYSVETYVHTWCTYKHLIYS